MLLQWQFPPCSSRSSRLPKVLSCVEERGEPRLQGRYRPPVKPAVSDPVSEPEPVEGSDEPKGDTIPPVALSLPWIPWRIRTLRDQDCGFAGELTVAAVCCGKR